MNQPRSSALHYGYHKRTGPKGDFKYWYLDDSTGLLYEGSKPAKYVVDQYERATNHPKLKDCGPNPWENYGNPNHQLIKCISNGVPYNKLGTTLPTVVEDYEARGLSLAYARMQQRFRTTTVLKIEHILSLHEIAFSELYSWAGKLRTVDIEKNDKFPFKWPPWQNVEQGLSELQRQHLNQLTPATDCSLDELSERIATIVNELLFIHPFREGNGRIARLVGDILAMQAEYPQVKYWYDQAEKDLYTEAVHAGYRGNNNPLSRIVREGIERNIKAFERLSSSVQLDGNSPE